MSLTQYGLLIELQSRDVQQCITIYTNTNDIKLTMFGELIDKASNRATAQAKEQHQAQHANVVLVCGREDAFLHCCSAGLSPMHALLFGHWMI